MCSVTLTTFNGYTLLQLCIYAQRGIGLLRHRRLFWLIPNYNWYK